MAREYDFMLPEDRARKEAEFEKERQDWISTRSRGMTRFLLLRGIQRMTIFFIAWGVVAVIFLHVRFAQVLQVTIGVLLMSPLLNLLEWHWNERRYFRQPKQKSPEERASRI